MVQRPLCPHSTQGYAKTVHCVHCVHGISFQLHRNCTGKGDSNLFRIHYGTQLIIYTNDVIIEDNLWIEGTVQGKVTVGAAKFEGEEEARVILNDNIDYETYPPDASDNLAIVTQGDILIPLKSPDDMILRGIFVTQHGHFGRELYSKGNWWWCDNLCPRPSPPWPWWLEDCWIKRKPYPADAQKDLLTIYGTIVSNGRVGTKWGYWYGWAGYNERYNYFDEKLSRDPPPLLPYISKTLNFISWEEIQ